MKCLICQSENVITKKTKMSDFLVSRIFGEDKVSNDIEVNLCHCNDCSFSFYDRRLTEDEEKKLYKDYRESEYQKIREKYDCWYTTKVNNAMNTDKTALDEQRNVIKKVISNNINRPIEIALDYGGNRGDTFYSDLGTKEKYVYDISNVDTINGVKKISSFAELQNHSFDFIMCNMTLEHISDPLDFTKNLYEIGKEGTYYYFEVPSENPFDNDKFSIMNNVKLLFNPYFSNFKLFKHYLKTRNQPYMPMTEHVNFYTPRSIKALMEKVGFEVVDVEENYEKSVLGGTLVLSALCRK